MLLRHDVVLLALCGKLSLGLVAVSFALAVFLVCIFHSDLLAQQVLPIHYVLGGIGSFERIVGHEAIALGHIVLITDDSWRQDQGAKLGKGVEQDFLVDLLVQVVDKELGADVGRLLLVGAGLVDTDWLLVQTDAVEDLGGVVGTLRGIELDETVALVGARDTIHGHVDIVHGAHLGHELPEIGLADALVEVADVDGRVLVLFPVAKKCQSGLGPTRRGSLKGNLPMFGHSEVRFDSRWS